MLHPLFHLMARQPQLLGSHAAAYGELISTELATQALALKHRALWGALAVCFFGVAAVLAGVSTLLWAMLVPALQPVPWIVILVPLVPFVLAVVCGLLARKPGTAQDAAFAELRRQVQADMELLRGMGAP
ncbi:MAG: phage holin family protein [Rhodoferax sp.]|nr:phage holin family protein [Rhodoferax sp.]